MLRRTYRILSCPYRDTRSKFISQLNPQLSSSPRQFELDQIVARVNQAVLQPLQSINLTGVWEKLKLDSFTYAVYYHGRVQVYNEQGRLVLQRRNYSFEQLLELKINCIIYGWDLDSCFDPAQGWGGIKTIIIPYRFSSDPEHELAATARRALIRDRIIGRLVAGDENFLQQDILGQEQVDRTCATNNTVDNIIITSNGQLEIYSAQLELIASSSYYSSFYNMLKAVGHIYMLIACYPYCKLTKDQADQILNLIEHLKKLDIIDIDCYQEIIIALKHLEAVVLSQYDKEVNFCPDVFSRKIKSLIDAAQHECKKNLDSVLVEAGIDLGGSRVYHAAALGPNRSLFESSCLGGSVFCFSDSMMGDKSAVRAAVIKLVENDPKFTQEQQHCSSPYARAC